MTSSLPGEYFDDLYAAQDDPWRISTGWYETRKRALVLAALPRARFQLAFEPGCSNGELTVLLAQRCDRVIAWDVVDAAIGRARERVAGLPDVEIRHGALPASWPDERAELIVLSEVGYYLDEADLGLAIDAAVEHLAPRGTVLAVHWRHAAPDYPLTGDRVHELISADDRLQRLARYQDEDLVLDVLVAGEPISVARRSGVV